MRVEFQMTAEQFGRLMDAGKPVAYMLGSGGVAPSSPQESANRAWQQLADELGFVWDTAIPIHGRDSRWFSAEKRPDGVPPSPADQSRGGA